MAAKLTLWDRIVMHNLRIEGNSVTMGDGTIMAIDKSRQGVPLTSSKVYVP